MPNAKHTLQMVFHNHKKQVRAIVEKYVRMYGSDSLASDQQKPVLFNITGAYRNEFYAQPIRDVFAIALLVVFVSWFVSFYAAIATLCLFLTMNSVPMGYWFPNHFDGEFVCVDGSTREFGVVIPTPEEEVRLASRNFAETNELAKLVGKLDEQQIVYDKRELITWSVGTSTSHCIYGRKLAPFCQFGVGIDNDRQIAAFLDAHDKRLSHDGVLVIMNSAGYGVRTDAGILYNDNKMECDTITPNIAARIVSGVGDNKMAMRFVERLVSIHQWLNYDYILAVVPQEDATMPQCGSHSKQRLLDNLGWGKNVIVIEVGGKQTNKFEFVDAVGRKITETTITDAAGKSHGSRRVFGQ